MKSKMVRLSLGVFTVFMLAGCGQAVTENGNVNENTQAEETSIFTTIDDGLGESDATNINEDLAMEDGNPAVDENNDCEKIHLDGYKTEITIYKNAADPGEYGKYIDYAEKYAIEYLEKNELDSSQVVSSKEANPLDFNESSMCTKYIYMTSDWKVYIGEGYQYIFSTNECEINLIYCPDIDMFINNNGEIYSLYILDEIFNLYGGSRASILCHVHDDWTEDYYKGYFEPECSLENFVDFRAELAKYNGGGEILSAHLPSKNYDGALLDEKKLEEFLTVYDRYAERATDEFNESGERVVSFVVK